MKDFKHPLYNEYFPRWKKVRAVCNEGEKELKDGRETYLPRPRGMIKGKAAEFYDMYSKLASFYNASGVTIDNLVGMLFVKPALADGVEHIPTSDLDGHGSSLEGFHKCIVRELLVTSRCSLWVDWDDHRNQAYVKLFEPELVLDHRVDSQGNLILVSLDTSSYDFVEEVGYKLIDKRKYLIIKDGHYAIQNYEIISNKEQGGGEFVLMDEVFPTNFRNDKFEEIPFQVYNPKGTGLQWVAPVSEGLVDLNLHHYHISADYGWLLHNMSQPTYIGYGISEDDANRFRVGSTVLNYFPTATATTNISILEMSGANASVLQKALLDKENQMVVLGARILETPKLGVEAAESLRIRQQGDKSNLDQVASVSVQAMRWVIKTMLSFSDNSKDNPEYSLDRDIRLDGMKPEEIRELVSAWQMGAVTQKTMLYNFKRAGMYPDEWGIEDEQDLLGSGQVDS